MSRIVVAAVSLVAALSMATAATGVPSQGDRVAGTIERLTLAGFPLTAHVNAKSGPQGEDAQGSFWQTIQDPALGEVTIRGHVTCLAVDGNKATVLASIDESTDPRVPVGSLFQTQITDNGSPGAGSDSTIALFGFQPGEGCPASFDIAPEVTILDGNFMVTDS